MGCVVPNNKYDGNTVVLKYTYLRSFGSVNAWKKNAKLAGMRSWRLMSQHPLGSDISAS